DIPLDDPKTLELFRGGDTEGVYQFESPGVRELCRNMKIDSFEEITAALAMYRPGPMRFIDEFIARKKGEMPIEYELPEMESVLRKTYGMIIYQEQTMTLMSILAGMSLGEADIIRCVISKKKSALIMEYHGKFLEGCARNGIDPGKSEAVWEKIVKFASYGFNKAHAVGYAMIAYRRAYLKANHPKEFEAVMNS
ncbi:MAG: DNA polymerase III subunit alpha, partial [Kiritimatiellaeota bacterium]|nr:DNA polymerase III subunit alpha [Kiritimatiellota bacterium]